MTACDTAFILKWADLMSAKLGVCGAVACEAVFDAAGGVQPEDGEATPEAAAIARAWAANPYALLDYVRESGKWCMAPTMGCYAAKCPWVRAIHGADVTQEEEK